MIVQCPYCATRYQLDATRLAGPKPMLKCSRCRHMFPAPSSASKKAAPAPPTAPPPASESLSLPFDETEWKDNAGEVSPARDIELAEPEEQFTLGTESNQDQLVVPDDEPVEPAVPPVEPRPDKRGSAEKRVATARAKSSRKGAASRRDDGDEAAVPSGAEADRERGKVRAIFVFLGLVVAAYAVLARALFASPALCDRLLGRLPLIGSLADDRLLTRKVALSEVVGNYQRIKDGKEVFVITGKAVNTSPVALHGVQVMGRLYDHSGQALDEKIIYCGNVISAKVLKDLTPTELSILQKLNPPKRFMIEPGESSTFVIVFMEPPRGIVEFSANVTAAQRQA